MNFVQPIRDIGKIDAMKKILRGTSLRDYALFVLGINSGLRISDLLALTVADVADEKGIRDRISLKEKKTSKTKDFPVGSTARKALKEYLDTREANPAAPLFLSRKSGAAIQRVQAYKILNRAARAIGIPDKIGTHTLRKTFGFHAYKAGRDLSMITKLLNHSSPAITLAYIGITRDDMDEVYLTLNL